MKKGKGIVTTKKSKGIVYLTQYTGGYFYYNGTTLDKINITFEKGVIL